jgi:hypothetical protein
VQYGSPGVALFSKVQAICVVGWCSLANCDSTAPSIRLISEIRRSTAIFFSTATVLIVENDVLLRVGPRCSSATSEKTGFQSDY